MEDRQKIIEKLVKIKALAERGIGGEQQTAQVMYATLKEKYKVTDAEIEKAAAVPVDISEIDLFSAYDKDMKKDREDGYYFHVSNDFNYCSKCGQLLDLDEWKRKEEPPEVAEELKFDD